MEANERQKKILAEKVIQYFEGDVAGKTFALWGLAFKDNTDDVRESPAFTIIDELTKRGAKIAAYDPKAIETAKREIERRGGNDKVSYATDEYTALKDADALIIATNWKEFFNPDFNRLRENLKAPVIFDGRNLYDLESMRDESFHYESIGRSTVVIDG